MPITQSSVTSLVLWNKLSDIKPTKYGPYLVTAAYVNLDGEIDMFSCVMIYDSTTGKWFDGDAALESNFHYNSEEILYWAPMPIAPMTV